MSTLTYPELVGRLFPRLSGGIRWGLERTRALLAAVGDPHLRFASIHVAGTNGKGTACHMMAWALSASGVRTGLYTSPHLVDFRERVAIDGAAISEEELLRAAEPLWPAIDSSGATFFEATTAIAFHAFARAGVEVVVAEVGLGGRLDATNVLTPAVCAITRIDLDHAAYLGDTLAQVALEKAGILKPAVPAVVAAAQEPEALDVVRRRAREVGAPLTLAAPLARVAEGTPAWVAETATLGEVALAPGLPGAHHRDNAAVAAHALALLPERLRPTAAQAAAGVAGAAPEGRFTRFEARGAAWILDVAHNPAGVAALVRTLEEVAPARPLVALFGAAADKDWRAMLGALAPAVDHVVVTAVPGVPAERRWDPAAAAAYLPAAVTVVAHFDRALEEAAARARGGGAGEAARGTVLVLGSFHTAGAALQRLRVSG